MIKIVNKEIKNDRDENPDNFNLLGRAGLKKFFQMLTEIDYSNEITIKFEKNNYFWDGEHKENKEKTLSSSENSSCLSNSILKEWFSSFINQTEDYIRNKTISDINSNMTSNEYISKYLKYLKQEDERKNDYIYPKYHKQLDDINFKYIIEDNIDKLAEVLYDY